MLLDAAWSTSYWFPFLASRGSSSAARFVLLPGRRAPGFPFWHREGRLRLHASLCCLFHELLVSLSGIEKVVWLHASLCCLVDEPLVSLSGIEKVVFGYMLRYAAWSTSSWFLFLAPRRSSSSAHFEKLPGRRAPGFPFWHREGRFGCAFCVAALSTSSWFPFLAWRRSSSAVHFDTLGYAAWSTSPWLFFPLAPRSSCSAARLVCCLFDELLVLPPWCREARLRLHTLLLSVGRAPGSPLWRGQARCRVHATLCCLVGEPLVIFFPDAAKLVFSCLLLCAACSMGSWFSPLAPGSSSSSAHFVMLPVGRAPGSPPWRREAALRLHASLCCLVDELLLRFVMLWSMRGFSIAPRSPPSAACFVTSCFVFVVCLNVQQCWRLFNAAFVASGSEQAFVCIVPGATLLLLSPASCPLQWTAVHSRGSRNSGRRQS